MYLLLRLMADDFRDGDFDEADIIDYAPDRGDLHDRLDLEAVGTDQIVVIAHVEALGTPSILFTEV